MTTMIRTRKPSASTAIIAAALAMGLSMIAARDAGAVSLSVQMACAADYFAYCSKHEIGSPGVRACMRANGLKLSKRCVSALVAAGEVSQAEVDRRAAAAAR